MNTIIDRRAAVKGHFDAYAVNNRWGDLYNPANPHSHSFLARRLRCVELLGDLTGKRLLDLGCGTGALIELLAGQQLEYEGVDIAPNMIQVAQTHIDQLGLAPGFKVRVDSVEALPYPTDSFDVVVGMGLLEYFDRPEAVIWEALRVSKPGAVLVFTIPQKSCLDDLIVRVSGPLRALVCQLAGKEGEIGRDKYTPKDFQKLFTDLGCRVVGERFYNMLILPYPVSRMWPRLAYGVAKRVEGRPGFRFFATGYIVACTK